MIRSNLHRPGTLAAGSAGRIKLIPMLLLLSFGLNVTALIAPFLKIDTFLSSEKIYSLPHSVALMWDARLYAIALLILGFSIVFPFVKLAVLSYIWFVSTSIKERKRMLGRIKPFGKWSLLDVFVVVIILVLTNNQTFISTHPLSGIYFFLAAIILSLVVAELINKLLYPELLPRTAALKLTKERLSDLSGWRSFIVPGLMLLSVATLIAAIGVPFLQISQFLLSSNTYSIFRSFLALCTPVTWLMSMVVLLFLIIFPLLSSTASIVVWYGRFNPVYRDRLEGTVGFLSHWSMLDVFGLALLVFLVEGDALICTEIQPGLFMLTGAIAVNLISSIVANHLIFSVKKIRGCNS
jgi:uncharacterized paraquat-inducible protein A